MTDIGVFVPPPLPAGMIPNTPEATLWLQQQADKNAENRDALTIIRDYISRFRLDPSLADWAWRQITSGRSQAEVALAIQDQPAYQQRFGTVIEAYRKKGLAPPQPAEILSYEEQFHQTMRAANMPESFYDSPEDAQRLMAGRWSINEVVSAVNEGYLKVKNAPIETRQAFQKYYGADGDAALAAFFIDPDKAQPILERAVSASQIGGQALRFGFNIDKTQAVRFSELGASQETAAQNFAQLQEMQPLFSETISEQDDLDAQVQGIQALFEGDAAAKQALRHRQEQRQANVSGGGGAAASSAGVIGLGTAEG